MPRTANTNQPPTGEIVERETVPPARYLSDPADEQSSFLRVEDVKNGVKFQMGDLAITLGDAGVNAMIRTLRKMTR